MCVYVYVHAECSLWEGLPNSVWELRESINNFQLTRGLVQEPQNIIFPVLTVLGDYSDYPTEVLRLGRTSVCNRTIL